MKTTKFLLPILLALFVLGCKTDDQSGVINSKGSAEISAAKLCKDTHNYPEGPLSDYFPDYRAKKIQKDFLKGYNKIIEIRNGAFEWKQNAAGVHITYKMFFEYFSLPHEYYTRIIPKTVVRCNIYNHYNVFEYDFNYYLRTVTTKADGQTNQQDYPLYRESANGNTTHKINSNYGNPLILDKDIYGFDKRVFYLVIRSLDYPDEVLFTFKIATEKYNTAIGNYEFTYSDGFDWTKTPQ